MEQLKVSEQNCSLGDQFEVLCCCVGMCCRGEFRGGRDLKRTFRRAIMMGERDAEKRRGRDILKGH